MKQRHPATPAVDMIITDGLDPELQPFLARDAIFGLDQLLTGQAPGDHIAVERIGAIVRLISQSLQMVRQ